MSAHSSSTERDTAAERGDPDFKRCRLDEYRETLAFTRHLGKFQG